MATMDSSSKASGEGPTRLVSVVLPAYDMGRYIGEALGSIAAQTYPHWEVLVIDDVGPKDGTEDIVRTFAGSMKGHRVEFVRHTANQGVSAARNTGIMAARGDYVAFLDPDDLLMPDHLRNAVAMLGGHDGYDVVTGSVESFRNEPGRSWTHKAWLAGWKVQHFPYSLAVYNFIQPSAVVVRRTAVVALGGFDTDPNIQHIEDYDLWIRLSEAGHRFGFMPHITARYRKHAGGATSQEDKFRVLHARLYAKHPDFFREGLRRMMRMAHEGLGHDAALRRGPLMRLLLWIDGLFIRVFKKLGIA